MSNPNNTSSNDEFIKEESFGTHFMIPIDIYFHSHEFESVEEWNTFMAKMKSDPEFRKAELIKRADGYVYDFAKDSPDDIVSLTVEAIKEGQDNGFDFITH